jgi:hypothetical protein
MRAVCAAIALGCLLAAIPVQSQNSPAYVREGDRIEQRFREHRNRLNAFFQELRTTVQRDAPALASQLQNAPPATSVWGYGMLPRIIDIAQPPTPISTFSYSWAVTEGYIKGETTKLDNAMADLARGSAELRNLVTTYRELVRNQQTVDQYIQYNRFWQREIAIDRPRFDRLTQLYNAMKSGNPDTADAIRKVLGKPVAPRFVRVRREGSRVVTLQVRVNTDIQDDAYLAQAKSAIENIWRAEEGGMQYAIQIEFRKANLRELPKKGDHVDMDKHIARFPADGGVLTTGAQFTYGTVGQAVVLGPGDLAPRTLAHEFGHILGFTDGYIRGYTDLGEKGFEILELTSLFDDIMSAPREGHVQVAHFKLLMESLNEK